MQTFIHRTRFLTQECEISDNKKCLLWHSVFDITSFLLPSSGVFFRNSFNRIGGKYIKARYVEYTDSTFTIKKLRSPDERHLGLMGPVIKAEVGDVIQVIFQNKVRFKFIKETKRQKNQAKNTTPCRN